MLVATQFASVTMRVTFLYGCHNHQIAPIKWTSSSQMPATTMKWRRRYAPIALFLLLLQVRNTHGFQVSNLQLGRTRSRSVRQQLSPSPTSDDHDDSSGRTSNVDGPSPSANARTTRSQPLLLAPESTESRQLIQNEFGLSPTQYEQLRNLAFLVCDWNVRVNLVSRKDCSPSVVWTRHVLPSVSATAHKSLPIHSARTVVDVGTGGGFPGLPLAIAFPDVEFLLLDSVGKKLVAVHDMAVQLGLSNVQVYHGRSEDLQPKQRFDVATGRSVSSLPQFCSWMHHLVGNSLMYWIGSSNSNSSRSSTPAASESEAGKDDDIPRDILDACSGDVAIEPLLRHLVSTDKRILTFDRAAVRKLARMPQAAKQPAPSEPRRSRTTFVGRQRQLSEPRRKQSDRQAPGKAKPKSSSSRGQWQRGEASRRGTDTFRRYDSNAGASPQQ